MSSLKKKKSRKVKTWEDPIVKELHLVREAHVKKFNYDLDAVFQDFLRYEAELKNQRATRAKKKRA